jgi:hypothetical protein
MRAKWSACSACATTRSPSSRQCRRSPMLEEQFAGLPADTTEENLQARIRGMILMAISNKTGSLVLTTGNKSEMAVGYCTLYGDMAGGFAVIKDIAKTLVYRARALAQHALVRDSRTDHQPPAIGRVEAGPDRSGQSAPLRGARRHRRGVHGKGSQPARDHCPAALPRPMCAASCICSRSANTSGGRHRSASASRSAVSARTGAIRSPIATATLLIARPCDLISDTISLRSSLEPRP